MKLLSLLLSSLFFYVDVWGAACCGGGFAAPSIIAGDDKAQLSTAYSLTEVVIENVDSQGIWRQSDEQQQVRTFRVEGAHILQDRWQLGLAVPVIERSSRRETFSGLGDISATLGYEYLPDWTYNPYRPKGIGYLQLTAPTGKSRADSEVGGLDSRGNGFWALGVGTLLTKSWSRWDIYSTFDIHHSFEKEISNSVVQGSLMPGWGGQLGLGLGYNIKDYRVGSAFIWTYEDPVVIKSEQQDLAGAVERYGTAVASISYLANDEWSGTATYSDQTLIGGPLNTSLGKSVAIQIQRRWGR